MIEESQKPQYTTVEKRLMEDGWKMRAQVPSILDYVFEVVNDWKEWKTGPDAIVVHADGDQLLVRAGCYDSEIGWEDGRNFNHTLPVRLSENQDEVISHNPEQGVFRLWSKDPSPSSSQE